MEAFILCSKTFQIGYIGVPLNIPFFFKSVWSTYHIFSQVVLKSGVQFGPPIALRTDLSHITTELWEIPVLRMAH